MRESFCPNCKGELEAGEGAFLKCSACKIFVPVEMAPQVSAVVELEAQSKREIPRPPGFEMRDLPRCLEISLPRQPPRKLAVGVLAFIAFIFFAPTLASCIFALSFLFSSEGQLMGALIVAAMGLPFSVGTLLPIYALAVMFKNKSYLVVKNAFVIFDSRPLKWFRPKYPTNVIKQLYCQATSYGFYQLMMLRHDGKVRQLWGSESLEAVLYLEQCLERQFNIEDRRVVGEHSED